MLKRKPIKTYYSHERKSAPVDGRTRAAALAKASVSAREVVN